MRDMIMPFGKHKGTKIKDLPSGYIYGLIMNAEWLKGKLRTALTEENALRYANKSRTRYSEDDYEMDEDFLEAYGPFGG